MRKALLVFLIAFAPLSNAADTFTRGAQGFLVSAGIARTCGATKQTSIYIGIAGAILGMYPDLAGGYGNVFLHDDWATYKKAHSGELAISLLPPVALHIGVDLIFHKATGGWENNAWIGEVVIVVVTGILLWLQLKELTSQEHKL
jgi:hypothetical protein